MNPIIQKLPKLNNTVIPITKYKRVKATAQSANMIMNFFWRESVLLLFITNTSSW